MTLKAKSQFHVQCTLVTAGESWSDWDFVVPSLKEAEEICVTQMAPSDTSTVLGHNFECNKTNDAYVNCVIALLHSGGKVTVIEKRVHPLSRKHSRKPKGAF